MTREEQIKYKAGTIADGCIAHGAPWKEYYQGFIDGARWADANPASLDEATEKMYPMTTTPPTPIEVAAHYNAAQQKLRDAFKAGAEWMANQNKN